MWAASTQSARSSPSPMAVSAAESPAHRFARTMAADSFQEDVDEEELLLEVADEGAVVEAILLVDTLELEVAGDVLVELDELAQSPPTPLSFNTLILVQLPD